MIALNDITITLFYLEIQENKIINQYESPYRDVPSICVEIAKMSTGINSHYYFYTPISINFFLFKFQRISEIELNFLHTSA